MMSTATAQIATARHIAKVAEQQIKVKTGMRFTILLCPSENTRKTPEQMLRIIAMSMNMNTGCFSMKGRAREVVELRFLGALLLRRYFPEVRLKQIADLFGGQDHTSVINGISRANKLLDTNDIVFTTKYNNAVKMINQWIKEK